MNSLKHRLLGVLELSLFMKRGIDRFGNDRRGMRMSYLWPVCLFPVGMIGVFMAQRPEIAGLSPFTVIILYIVRDAAVLALIYAFAAKAADSMGKANDFPRFITAVNWLSITDAVLSVPILIMLAAGQQWVSTYGVITVTSLYGYVLFGYVAVRAFKMPWELGAMAAAICIGITEMSLTMLFDVAAWIRG